MDADCLQTVNVDLPVGIMSSSRLVVAGMEILMMTTNPRREYNGHDV